jgi:peptidoglycan/xylan/chitin deacetylase (PgdA/CDA1 family)
MHTDYRSPAPVALTFDGPDPIWTPLVFDALASVGVRATFFVVAPRVARYPSLISSMRERGHDVAFHCVEHVSHDAMTRREIEIDVDSGLLALGRPCGIGERRGASSHRRPKRWQQIPAPARRLGR